MKYLVTGGAGFIGSNLTNMLIRHNHEIIVIDDLSMGKLENIDDLTKIKFFKGSITDNYLMEDILTRYQFDYVFHLAAVASVADSVERPVETHEVNYNAVLNILNLIREHQPGLKRFVFASSAAVYGDDPELPKKETSPIKPMTQYAIDKFAAERTTIVFNDLYHVPTSSVRFFNVYGPNQNPESPYSGVISILQDCYNRILSGEKRYFTLYGDGSQLRDFIYIEDVLQALMIVVETVDSLGQVFNVGTGKEADLQQIIEEFNNIYGFELPVKYQDKRAGDIHRSVADISNLKNIGFCPKNTISEGLYKFVECYKDK